MWTPTHVIVTVLRARNLLEKGKGGNDAYCMIGMGKEKFLTSVKPKSTMPQWDEQAEFALGEREDLKITVYHKSSIIDEFIGRIVINVSELSFEHNKSFVTWYKLLGKEKSESNKKPDKERGEVEVRIEFVVRSKTGSMMDLSMKSKENSLSLRNLKDKSFNIKHSLGDKFKILNPMSRRSSKFAGENQLAEQSKRMGGSKLDFLEGEDVASLTSSYSSINGPTLNRNASAGGQMNSLNRFNPARASFISKTSSKMDNDGNSSANGGADFTHNEDDFNDDPDSESAGNVNSSFSQRRNSSRFGPSARQLSKRSSTGSSQQQQAPNSSSANEAQSQLKITNPFGSDFGSSDIPATTNEEEDSTSPVSETPSGGAKSIHIAPLPPFTTTTAPTTSTPTMSKRGQAAGSTSSSGSSGSSHAMGKPTTTTIEKPPVPSPRDHRKSSHHNRHELVNSTIDEENTLSSIKNVSSSQRGDKSRDHQATMDSFESSFATTNSSANPAIIATATSTNLIKSSNDSGNASIIKSNDEGKPSQQTLSNPSRSTLTKTASESSASSLSDEPAMKPPQEHKKKAPLPPSSSQSPPPLPQLPTHQQPVTKKNSAAKIIDATAAILPPPEQYSDQALPEPKATTASASKLSSTADDQIDWESSDDDEIVKREIETFERHQNLRQSERRRLMPTEDLTSDLKSEADFNVDSASLRHQNHLNRVASFKSSAAQPPSNLISVASSNRQRSNETLNNRQSNPFNEDEEIKTPDFDYRFQTADQGLDDTKKQSQLMNGHETAGARKSGLPDLVNQKDGSSNDKAKKYLEDLDGVKFNDVQVPDTLKKQLEYFDREELLQLIAYQKKYLDYKESRIKDLENYIDNLVVKIIETEPLILMNASNVLNKSRNLI